MKKFILLFLVLMSSFFCLNANEKLALMVSDFAKRQDKSTLVFYDLRWCGASSVKLPNAVNHLSELSKCYKIVVCHTSDDLKIYDGIKIDTFINLNDFSTKQFGNKKEWKNMAKQYKKIYHANIS